MINHFPKEVVFHIGKRTFITEVNMQMCSIRNFSADYTLQSQLHHQVHMQLQSDNVSRVRFVAKTNVCAVVVYEFVEMKSIPEM